MLSTFLGALGQLLFKLSLLNTVLLTFAMGFGVYIISALIYFYVISRAHVSWAYSMGGFSYIFAVILAATFIEHVPPLRWIGTIIITIGVLFIIIS